MKPGQIENWALEIIERVERNQPLEDTRVELKSDWIDPKKAARRIAGHANAARGENILWLIGVNEEKGVVDIKQEELSDWFEKVKREFDGLPPDLIDIIVPYNDKIVFALLFETGRAPFVVKNPDTKGGSVSLEVPWREGTRVRTANRSDLVKLLVPITRLPEVEILAGEFHYTSETSGRNWKLELKTYITPIDERRIILPRHRSIIEFEIPGLREKTQFNEVVFMPPDWGGGHPDGTNLMPPLIYTNPSSAIIEGPGRLDIEAKHSASIIETFKPSVAFVTVNLLPAGTDIPIILDLQLSLIQ